MIPILFESNESTFTSNGVCRLVDCVICEVTEERNGVYECEFTYPITGRNYDKIKEGMIIYTTHDESGEPQPFDIYKRSVPIDGVVTFNAAHISYRLRNYILKPFTASTISQTFVSLVANATPTNCPFTFWTDKEVESAFTLNVPKSIRSVLGGEDGSILDVYGTGEYEFDKFAVKLHLHRGQDTNVKIQYGKNLIDLTDETDAGNLYNAVVPYWLSSEEGAAPVMLSFPYYVTASDFNYQTEQVLPIVLDLSANFQEEPTRAQLREKALDILEASETRKGTRTINVDFVQLWQTEQYKDVAPLEKLSLCDTVEVIYGDTVVAQKITTVVYDALLERYKSMELGATTQTLADVLLASMERAISEPVKRAIDKTAAAIKHATDMITGNDGGYVVIRMNDDDQPMELLICDTPDYLTAQNVWRWNQNGLGFSSTGYEGPYGTAITADGMIIGSYVKTGIISSISGRSYFDLDKGALLSASVASTLSGESAVYINNGKIYFYGSESTHDDITIGMIGKTAVRDTAGTVFPAYAINAREGTITMGHYDDDQRRYMVDMWILGTEQNDAQILIPGGVVPPRIRFGNVAFSRDVYFFGADDATDYLATIDTNGTDKFLRIKALDEYGTTIQTKAFLNSGGNPFKIKNGVISYNPAVLGVTEYYIESGTSASTGTSTKHGYIGPKTTNATAIANDTAFRIWATNPDIIEIGGESSQYGIVTCYIGNWLGQAVKVSGGGYTNFRNVLRYSAYVEQDVSCAGLIQRSDGRYKTVLDWDDRFDVLIEKLRPVLFDWKNRDDDEYHHLGLIAQEVEKEMHALGLEDCIVHTSESGEKSIAYSEVSTLLLKKVQQQQTKIDALEERIARLEALIGG